MTPDGFRKWVISSDKGRQIIYHQGKTLSDSKRSLVLGAIARDAYENGEVRLVQKRLTPATGITKHTRGTFAYMAVKL